MLTLIVLALLAVTSAKPTGKARDPMINHGLFEGDIMGIDPDTDRNAVPRDSMRWPGGVVPYEIDDSLSGLTDSITSAMKHIQDNSCITFVKRSSQTDYVRIFEGKGCYSYWGYLGRGQQDISLGVGCEPFGTIVHELLHAIGFEHEHNRSDRDDHLTINWDNIEEEWYYAFKKLRPEQNRLLTGFDFDSVMLYGQESFSRGPGLKSMEAKDGRFMKEVYDKDGLSKSDIKRMRILYECEN